MSRSTQQTTPHAAPGIHTRSQKEDATLRRVFGFVACTSLLTALPWWINPGQSAESGRSRDAAGQSASSSPTAAQLFLQGRENYLAGRFPEAVTALEAADRLAADLS